MAAFTSRHRAKPSQAKAKAKAEAEAEAEAQAEAQAKPSSIATANQKYFDSVIALRSNASSCLCNMQQRMHSDSFCIYQIMRTEHGVLGGIRDTAASCW